MELQPFSAKLQFGHHSLALVERCGKGKAVEDIGRLGRRSEYFADKVPNGQDATSSQAA